MCGENLTPSRPSRPPIITKQLGNRRPFTRLSFLLKHYAYACLISLFVLRALPIYNLSVAPGTGSNVGALRH